MQNFYLVEFHDIDKVCGKMYNIFIKSWFSTKEVKYDNFFYRAFFRSKPRTNEEACKGSAGGTSAQEKNHKSRKLIVKKHPNGCFFHL